MNLIESGSQFEPIKEQPELLEIHHIFERAKNGGVRIKSGNRIKFIGFFKTSDTADALENALLEMGCGVERENNKIIVEREFSEREIEEANLDYRFV